MVDRSWPTARGPNAPLAHMVEHLSCKEKVLSSILRGGILLYDILYDTKVYFMTL